MKLRAIRSGVVGFLVLLVISVAAGPALAHPADEGRQDVVFSIHNGQLSWTHDLWLGPLLGQPMWAQQIDTNNDGAASPAEQQLFVDKLSTMVELHVDGQLVAAKLQSFHVAEYAKFISQPAEPQVSLVFVAPISAGDHTIDYLTKIDPRRIKFAARFPSGGGLQVKSPTADATSYHADLTIKPIALTQNNNAPQAEVPAGDSTSLLSIANGTSLAPAISSLIQGSNFSPLLLLAGLLVSFGVGAIHALTPGHGKGIIAAYMVGDRGRLSHALALAGTMTITHTSSVIVLGLIAILASRVILPQILTPWLTVISGGLILVVGGSLFWQRLHSRIPVAISANAHSHEPETQHAHADEHAHTHVDEHGHVYEHVHSHEDRLPAAAAAHAPGTAPEHTHVHDDGQTYLQVHADSNGHPQPVEPSHSDEHAHSDTIHTDVDLHHDPASDGGGFVHTHDGHTHSHLSLDDVRDTGTNRITWRSLIALGISGGLLPCADALAILLLSVSVNRIILGLILLVAFSLGIALTLTLIGIIASGGQRVLRRYNKLEPLLARLPLASSVVVLALGVVITWEGAVALIH